MLLFSIMAVLGPLRIQFNRENGMTCNRLGIKWNLCPHFFPMHRSPEDFAKSVFGKFILPKLSRVVVNKLVEGLGAVALNA